jgi:hypothetical protein
MVKLLLKCSASQEKEYKKKFGDMVIHFSEDPDSKYPCCLPVFRCEDPVIVANTLTGKRERIVQVSYQPQSYSPARHIRMGTAYGNSYDEIQEVIGQMKTIEDLSVG